MFSHAPSVMGWVGSRSLNSEAQLWMTFHCLQARESSFPPTKTFKFAPAYTGQLLFSVEEIRGLAAPSNKMLKPPSPLQTPPGLLSPEPSCALLTHPGVLLHEGS